MMTHLSALALGAPGAVGYRLIYGQFPQSLDIAALADELQDKPILKKYDDHLLVLIPGSEADSLTRWSAWFFDQVPPVTDLPPLIDKLRVFAQSLQDALAGDRAPVSSSGAGGQSVHQIILGQLLADMSQLGKLSSKRFLQVYGDKLAQYGMARAVALVACKPQGTGLVVVSDQSLMAHGDEFVRLVQDNRSETAQFISYHAGAQSDEKFEGTLLAESLGAKGLCLHVPALGERGVGLLLVDAEDEEAVQGYDRLLASLCDLAFLGLRQKKKIEEGGGHQRLWKGLGLVAVLCLLVCLFTPANLIVTATALSRPQISQSVNLAFDSNLQTVTVDVGDMVEKGEVIAEMRAPGLEARRSEIGLQMSVEELSGKAALGKNDYGSYQLSMQKIETQRAELQQIDKKLAQLSVEAPINGTIIQTIGRDSLGRHVPTGQTLAIIQPDHCFAVSLTFSHVDAPLVQPGQKGSVFFRGISDQSYPFTVLTPVYVETNAQSGAQRLVALAYLDGDDQDRLISGLSGFARLEADRKLRIVVLTRYVVEYLKVKAWTYLGLHF